MKTYKEITDLNYFDLSFLLGVTIPEAKSIIADYYGDPDLRVTVKKKIPIIQCRWKIHSNSNLDGLNQIEYLIGMYNKGVDMNCLRKWGEDKTNIQKGKFTRKHQILNEILNDSQLEKLQGIWKRSKAVIETT